MWSGLQQLELLGPKIVTFALLLELRILVCARSWSVCVCVCEVLILGDG